MLMKIRKMKEFGNILLGTYDLVFPWNLSLKGKYSVLVKDSYFSHSPDLFDAGL